MVESLILILAVVAGFVVVMTKDMAPSAPKTPAGETTATTPAAEKTPTV